MRAARRQCQYEPRCEKTGLRGLTQTRLIARTLISFIRKIFLKYDWFRSMGLRPSNWLKVSMGVSGARSILT